MVQMRREWIGTATEVKVMGEIESVAQKLGERISMKCGKRKKSNQEAHRASNLNFVVDATPIRVIVRFIHEPLALTLDVDTSRLLVSFHLGCFFGFGFLIYGGRYFSKAIARIPNFEHDVENLAINLPWR